MARVSPESIGDLTITAAEAERYLDVPASTFRKWAAESMAAVQRGDHGAIRLPLVGYRRDGSAEYDLAALMEMLKGWRRMAHHVRPARRRG